jgi:hypothetical protein
MHRVTLAILLPTEIVRSLNINALKNINYPDKVGFKVENAIFQKVKP